MFIFILLGSATLTTVPSEAISGSNRFLHGLTAPLRWGGSVMGVAKNVMGGTVDVTKKVVIGTTNTIKNVVTAPVRAVQSIQGVVHNVDLMTKQTNELFPILKESIGRSESMVQKTGTSILKAVPRLRLSIGIAAGSIAALSTGSLYMRARRSKLETESNKKRTAFEKLHQ